MAQLIPELETLGPQIFGTKAAIFASVALLFYEYLLTLNDEIDYIWKKRFTTVTLLFIINRYYVMIVIGIITLTAQVGTVFDPQTCERFSIFFPYATGLVLTITPDIVLALRVYAIYGKSKIMAAILTVYLIIELVVAVWIYSAPGLLQPFSVPSSVENNQNFHLCIVVANDQFGNLQSADFQFMQAIYETAVFILILYKVIKASLRGPKSAILAIIAKQGIVYYIILLSANLTWALMTLLASPGLKYAAANPTFVLACIMVNRITLSLRSHIIDPSAEMNSDIGLDMPWSLPNSWRTRLQSDDSLSGRPPSAELAIMRPSEEMDSGGNTLVDVSARDYELDELQSIVVEKGVGSNSKGNEAGPSHKLP